MEFGAIGRRGHLVDWDGVPIIFSRCIEYLAVLFSWFNEDVLRCDKAMWKEAPDPVWYVEDVIVAFFFVHVGHDLVNLEGNGRVVLLPPTEEGVSCCG